MTEKSSKIPPAVANAVERMLKRSQTKILFPVITWGLVKSYVKDDKDVFSDLEIRRIYEKSVQELKQLLGHDLHIGGKYYDAYSSRNLPAHKVVQVLGEKKYKLNPLFKDCAKELQHWLVERIRNYIDSKLGIVTKLAAQETRAKIADSPSDFVRAIRAHIDTSAANFEILGFAIIRVHLEKFACKIYRDTRTSAHDAGVDLSTNFGVVYQIKKLKVTNLSAAKNIYKELKTNFDKERLDDGKVILIIDDISKEIKKYLIDMKIQSIDKNDLLKLASQFEDREDREKVLRVVYEEFRREYASDI